MKKIINGKMYNTATADVISEWDNGCSVTDFSYCREVLYRKKNGTFFLFGEGEGLSRYASHQGNTSGYGNAIIPMTEDEAKQWLEEYGDVDEYVECFGEPEE